MNYIVLLYKCLIFVILKSILKLWLIKIMCIIWLFVVYLWIMIDLNVCKGILKLN